MGYKVWTSYVSEEDFTDVDNLDIDRLMGLRVSSGKSLKGKWPEVRLRVVTEYPPADTFRCGTLFLVSPKLLEIFTDVVHASAFEALPVKVKYSGKEFNYYFLNMLERVDALDRANSDYTEDEDGDVDDINRLAIDEEAAEGRGVFELDAIEWVICAREDVAERIESTCSGVSFIDPADWSPY